MVNVLETFVELLVSGISQMAVGLASGISTFAKGLFLETNPETGVVTGLSVFGGIIGIFAGVALSIGITTRVYTWVTSLGN